MKFLKLTSTDGTPIIVNLSTITRLQQMDENCAIFFVDGSSLTVKDCYEQVASYIKGL